MTTERKIMRVIQSCRTLDQMAAARQWVDDLVRRGVIARSAAHLLGRTADSTEAVLGWYSPTASTAWRAGGPRAMMSR